MLSDAAEIGLAQRCAAAMLARDRAARGFGIRIDQVRPGFARLMMLVEEAMINGHATVHGGVLFTFADTAFALACNSRDVPHVALEASISFIASAHLGDRLFAVAVERSMRGRTGVYDVTIARSEGDDAGDTVALFRGTAYRIGGTVLDGGAK